MNQKNKLIISTLGPSSLRKEIVQKMDESGVDVFRINLSHTNIDDYKKICLKLKNGLPNKFVLILRAHNYELA